MSADADLSANHASGTNGGGACDARLGRNHGAFTYNHVVGDLDEVVQFAALANHGASQRGAVDGCQRADVAVVFDHNIARLRHFRVAAVLLWRKPKPVGANHRSGLEVASLANEASVQNSNATLQVVRPMRTSRPMCTWACTPTRSPMTAPLNDHTVQ